MEEYSRAVYKLPGDADVHAAIEKMPFVIWKKPNISRLTRQMMTNTGGHRQKKQKRQTRMFSAIERGERSKQRQLLHQ